jgi:predicted O-methyltransferase YrrM
MSEKEMVSSIFKTARGFWEARILMTAAELDIFSRLLDAPKTAAQVVDELSSDPRGTEMLLDALVALEMLVKKDDAFRVGPGLEKALSSSTPETILPIILHMAHLWKPWGELTEIVREGKKEVPAKAAEWDEDELKSFINAMHSMGRGVAREVVAKLDLAGKENLIDVGGGSGVYTIAMLSGIPKMRATIFDRPNVIAIAREKVAEANLTDRVTFAEGDFYKDNLPGGHDVALLSAIIHQNSPGQNVELYRKVFDALEPGGSIVIRDHVMSDDHTETVDGALFAINMLVATPQGGVYSFAEIKNGLEQAGFTRAELVHHAEMDSLVTAQKP